MTWPRPTNPFVLGPIALLTAIIISWIFMYSRGFEFSNFEEFRSTLSAHPWIALALLIVLPALPVPTSALLLLFGYVWRNDPWIAVPLGIGALLLNATWTYLLAAYPARKLFENLLSRLKIQLPDKTKFNPLKLTLILKLTPGIPMFLQNYSLGLLRVPFRIYLLCTLLSNGSLASAFILAGAGFGTSSLSTLLAGLSILALMFTLAALARRDLKRTLVN